MIHCWALAGVKRKHAALCAGQPNNNGVRPASHCTGKGLLWIVCLWVLAVILWVHHQVNQYNLCKMLWCKEVVELIDSMWFSDTYLAKYEAGTSTFRGWGIFCACSDGDGGLQRYVYLVTQTCKSRKEPACSPDCKLLNMFGFNCWTTPESEAVVTVKLQGWGYFEVVLLVAPLKPFKKISTAGADLLIFCKMDQRWMILRIGTGMIPPCVGYRPQLCVWWWTSRNFAFPRRLSIQSQVRPIPLESSNSVCWPGESIE